MKKFIIAIATFVSMNQTINAQTIASMNEAAVSHKRIRFLGARNFIDIGLNQNRAQAVSNDGEQVIGATAYNNFYYQDLFGVVSIHENHGTQIIGHHPSPFFTYPLSSEGVSINNEKTILGQSKTPSGPIEPFIRYADESFNRAVSKDYISLYSNDLVTSIQITPTKMNNNNHIIGVSNVIGGSGSIVKSLYWPDPLSPAYEIFGDAKDINDQNQLLVNFCSGHFRCHTSNMSDRFLITNNAIVNVPSGYDKIFANALNNNGDVVGVLLNETNNQTRMFKYTASSGFTYLDQLSIYSYPDTAVIDINDQGIIAFYGAGAGPKLRYQGQVYDVRSLISSNSRWRNASAIHIKEISNIKNGTFKVIGYGQFDGEENHQGFIFKFRAL